VTVRLFNDNLHNLEYLQGVRGLEPGLIALSRPVLDIIALQSAAIHRQGVAINLELH
jgi:hypothetical protein